jgi:hypothetical protein
MTLVMDTETADRDFCQKIIARDSNRLDILRSIASIFVINNREIGQNFNLSID